MCCDETLRCLRPLHGETQRLFLSQPRARVGSRWDWVIPHLSGTAGPGREDHRGRAEAGGDQHQQQSGAAPVHVPGLVGRWAGEALGTLTGAGDPHLGPSLGQGTRTWDPHWGRGPLPGTLTGAGDLPSPGDPHWGGGCTPGDPSHGEKDLGNEGSGDSSLGRGDLEMGGLGTLLLSRKWGFGDSAPGVALGRTWCPLLPFPHRGLGVRIGPGATWVTPVLVPRPCSPATPTTWCGCGR